VPDNNWADDNSISSGYAVYDSNVWNDAVTTGVYSGFDGSNFPSDKSLHNIDAPEPLFSFPLQGHVTPAPVWCGVQASIRTIGAVPLTVSTIFLLS
jgi:hypothetical protein